MDYRGGYCKKKHAPALSLTNFVRLEDDSQDDDMEEDMLSVSSGSSDNLKNFQKPSCAWDGHRFEKQPWSDYCRPCVKVKKDEEAESGLLTDRIISSNLSYLDRSPYDLKYVLCKCVLSHKKLTDVNALTYYHYIQYLDLSWNNITTLAPLGQLPLLQHLNVSHNRIEVLLDFKAPFYLGFVNFSHNLIETIPDLTEFWSIHHLDISYNHIQKISGLGNLRYLIDLNLSHNQIATLENLNNLRIQFLILHHNSIEYNTKGTMHLSTLNYLRSVDLANNKLSSLAMFESAENLESINMSMNNICNLVELNYLQNLRYLSKLNLSNNPVSKMNRYISVCLKLIKNLMVLDGNEISPEQRIEIKSNSEIDPKLQAGESRVEFILLQQINRPDIGPHIVPYDQPAPMILLLVGPPGSKKMSMAEEICTEIKHCVFGISHTTRPRTIVEVDNKDYYFISKETFRELTRSGMFIAITEFNNNSYGISHDEFKKGNEGILIFHGDLNTALSLRVAGINPILVLTIPSSEITHLNFLKLKYYYDKINQSVRRIENSPMFLRIIEDISRPGVDDPTKYSRIILEDIIQDILDEKNYEDILQDNIRFIHDTAHTVTPIAVSEVSTDTPEIIELPITGILKRGSISKDCPRVSFFECPIPRHSTTTSNKFETVLSSESFSERRSLPSIIIDGIYRSVSGCMAVDSERRDSDQQYYELILSALSRSHVFHKKSDETSYLKPDEIFHRIRDENLATFFQAIIESRTALLEIHLSNPGLFREVIFTDEDECVTKMKKFIKSIAATSQSIKPKISMKDDPSYQRIIASRLEHTDIQQLSGRCAINYDTKCSCKNREESKDV